MVKENIGMNLVSEDIHICNYSKIDKFPTHIGLRPKLFREDLCLAVERIHVDDETFPEPVHRDKSSMTTRKKISGLIKY